MTEKLAAVLGEGQWKSLKKMLVEALVAFEIIVMVHRIGGIDRRRSDCRNENKMMTMMKRTWP